MYDWRDAKNQTCNAKPWNRKQKLKQQNVHLENLVLNLGNQIKDLEQYSHRQNLEIQGVAMNDDQETPQELEMKVLSILQHVDGSVDW